MSRPRATHFVSALLRQDRGRPTKEQASNNEQATTSKQQQASNKTATQPQAIIEKYRSQRALTKNRIN